MKNGIVIGTIACVVAIILIGSALAPIINITTTTTTTVDNDGAVGLRMDKVSSGDFTINYGLVGDAFTATNGTDTQVIDDLCIFYADDNVAVWMDDSSVIMLGKDADNNTIDEKLSDESTITITKSSAGLEITDGTITQTFPVPTWAYIPKSTGSYGFFLNETEINTGGLPVQYVGSFAGVDCYNSINSFDLPITLDAALTGSELSGAKWIKQTTETTPEELNPDDLHIIPLDPSVIDLDPEPDAVIMTVPTPTYTDGVWGYDIISGGDNDGKARIVSYSGSGGDIVIPSTVGGYTVAELGKGGTNENMIDFTIVTSLGTLVIPDTVNIINKYAFKSASSTSYSHFTGSLIIPGSVKTIDSYAFGDQRFNSIYISDGVENINDHAFYSDFAVDFIYLPESVGYLGGQSFQGLSPNNLISELKDTVTYTTKAFYFYYAATKLNVLDLGTLDLANLGDTNFKYKEIKDNVPALGYLASLQYKETVENDGPASVLLNVIPLITIVGVLLFAVGFTIYRRNY